MEKAHRASWRAAGLVGALLAGSNLAGPIAAQTASIPASANPAPEEDIIVTAQKVSERVSKVPISIAVLDERAISDRGVIDLQRINGVTPSINVSVQGPNTSVYIRGVGTQLPAPFGTPTVATNLDGVYLNQSSSLNASFYDVDRIEVLKGPQGTLYGRNATAGALNIINKRPTFDLDGYVRGEAGNYDLFRVEGALNVPLGQTIALRGAFQRYKHDGYLTDGYDDADQWAGRVRGLWEPASNVSVLLTGDYFHRKGKGQGSILLPTTQRFVNLDEPWLGASQPGYLNNKSWGVTGEFNWDFGAATLTYQPAYRDTHTSNLSFSNGSVNGIFADVFGKQFTNELRLASSNASAFRWLVGAYYFDEKAGTFTRRFLTVAAPPVRDSVIDVPIVNTRSYAGFAQATYSIMPTLRLTGGLRYTHDLKYSDGSGYAALNTDAAGAPVAGSVFPIAARTSFNKLTWKIGADLDLAPDSLLYATVSTGFKAGGINPSLQGTQPAYVSNCCGPVTFGPATFAPETLTAYAIGTKNRLFDRRLTLNAEAYYWDYRNEQVTISGLVNSGPTTTVPNSQPYVINAGAAKLYGLDVDGSLRIGSNGHLSFGLAYQHTEYGSFVLARTLRNTGNLANPAGYSVQSAATDLTGKRLPFAPTFAGTVGYSHSLHIGGSTITPRVDLRLTDSYFLNFNYFPNNAIDSRATQAGFVKGDLALSYSTPGDRFEVTAYVRNVTNEATLSRSGQAASSPDFYGTIEPPRTFGVTAKANF